VFLLPAEHINGVYLKDGKNRNPLEEHLTITDAEGRFLIHFDEDETQIAAAHPDGFTIVPLEEFKASGELKLKKWARVSGDRPAEGADAEQSVSFTCYPVPGISFHIYETEIAADGSFDQKFTPPGNITVHRTLPLGDGGSRSFPVENFILEPGESRKVSLGAIPEEAKREIPR
jgi:hypothetical protein